MGFSPINLQQRKFCCVREGNLVFMGLCAHAKDKLCGSGPDLEVGAPKHGLITEAYLVFHKD